MSTVGLALVGQRAVPEELGRDLVGPTQRKMTHNMKLADLAAPALGPAHPHERGGAVSAAHRNHHLGQVEDAFVHDYNFEAQLNTFHSQGRAADPGAPAWAGGGGGGGGRFQRPAAAAAGRGEPKRKKKAAAPAAAGEDPFAWGGKAGPWAATGPEEVMLTEEQTKQLEDYRQEQEQTKKAKTKRAPEEHVDNSVFHGKSQTRYDGSSWMQRPKDLKKENEVCYVPKKHLRTFSGHTKGVNAIRFFPKHGHLLLSAGLDGKVKIWDVASGQPMRTYSGHSKGVRDIAFSNDGRRFISVSYDKNVKLWDTETGKVVTTLSTGKIPYCGKFHPSPDYQNVVLCGTHDKKIVQWDLGTGEVVQEYNEHMGAVNTITFVDQGRRFVSSSDDKTMRVWEFGIPVQIKYIADPSMHSMPSVAAHPEKEYMVCQSLDNRVVTYSTKDKFKFQGKKQFKGHNVSGYACQVNISPDGRFVMSGDAEGRCFFWDWKTSRFLKKLRAHDGACIGCEWHPLETSKVATCGWDGLVKYWD